MKQHAELAVEFVLDGGGVTGRMISTRDLSQLPDVDGLRLTLQSMAMLDAILSPEWQFRYYFFYAALDAGQQLGSMRNGSGDHVYAHFGPAGCWLKGFAHESPMVPYREVPERIWPGILDAVPTAFVGCSREPAFSVEEVTFCIRRRYGDRTWQVGPIDFPSGHPDPDGSEFLLSPLDGMPRTYQEWAADYYEHEVSLSAVEHVYRHRPLTAEVVTQLNPEARLEELAADASEIGYPGPSRHG